MTCLLYSSVQCFATWKRSLLNLFLISFVNTFFDDFIIINILCAGCILKQTYDGTHALSTENARTMKVSIFNHFQVPSGKPVINAKISDPRGIQKEIKSAHGHIEETIEGEGQGVYSACFTNEGVNGADGGHVSVQVHFFQPHHAISDEELLKELRILQGKRLPGQDKGLKADQLHDSIALAESLMDDVQRIRGEIHYLTYRTKRHKQTCDSNAWRTQWLTFLEVIVLVACALMQVNAVKGYFETSNGDRIEGGQAKGFEYQSKYEPIRNPSGPGINPAQGFGPGSSSFGMPPILPQMFQSSQPAQAAVAPPQMYQPPPYKNAYQTQYGKNEEYQKEIPSQGIMPERYGGGQQAQSRQSRQYQDR
jgi:hypothetical protein